MGAYWSIHARDKSAFERYLSLLIPFHSHSPSPRTPALLGLHLLHLLVAHPADYHPTLARLAHSPEVRFVMQLEQCLLEGTYQRLLVARSQVPMEEYGWFVDQLVERVRGEIAEGLEGAFRELDLKTALGMLLLGKDQAPLLTEFAKKRGWNLSGDKIIFPLIKQQVDSETNPRDMIQRALLYATALEQIV